MIKISNKFLWQIRILTKSVIQCLQSLVVTTVITFEGDIYQERLLSFHFQSYPVLLFVFTETKAINLVFILVTL